MIFGDDYVLIIAVAMKPVFLVSTTTSAFLYFATFKWHSYFEFGVFAFITITTDISFFYA